jgi:hypothetical protein
VKVTPNKWVCPRCKGNDAYWAKEQTRQVGDLIDSANSTVNSAFKRGIETDSALCRGCGERMNFVKESKVAEVEEKKRNKNFEIKLFLWIGIPLFIILLYFAITIDLSLIESL